MSVAVENVVNDDLQKPKTGPRPWGLSPQDLVIYLMVFPAVFAYVVFSYIPMPGMLVAFCEYSGAGYKGWVGLQNFVNIFKLPRFSLAIRNNLLYAALGYLINFPAPIILALLFNELRQLRFKKAVQTIMTIPHFVNWIVVGGIFKILLDPDYGWVNSLIVTLGGTEVYFLGDPNWFPFSYLALSIWKGVGYGSIIYLATMASIDHSLYEAAAIDGAGRWRQTWHVTLPALKGIILLRLILSFSSILNLFDAMYILENKSNKDICTVLDTLIFSTFRNSNNFGQAQAMSLFKLAFGAVVTVIVNETAKRLSDDGRGIF